MAVSASQVSLTWSGSPNTSDVENTHTVSYVFTLTANGNTGTTSFTLNITPACQYSTITQSIALASMTTPIYGSAYQTITNAHFQPAAENAGHWAAGTCTISFKIDRGGSSYQFCEDPDATPDFYKMTCEGTEPNTDTILHWYTYNEDTVGAHTITIVAYYSNWPEPTTPSYTFTTTLQGTFEDVCILDSFEVTPAQSATPHQVSHELYQPAQSFQFEIAFSPATCNYDKVYNVFVDGFESYPSWLAIYPAGDTGTPLLPNVQHQHTLAQVNIETQTQAQSGVYTVSIEAAINTTPLQLSTDRYEFIVSLWYEPCGSLTITCADPSDMPFTIAPGASPSTQVLSACSILYHDGSDPAGACGPLHYEMSYGHSEITFTESSLTFSFSTFDPTQVGDHEVIYIVETQDWDEYNGVMRQQRSFTVQISAACDTTIFVDPASSKIVHPVRTTAMVYPIPSLDDSVSDGSGFCGAYTLVHIGITSVDHASPDEIATFDGTDSYTIQGTLDSQWGNYVITYGVTLDDYPGFNQQEISFNVEIIPDCSAALVNQFSAVSFTPETKGLISTHDFTGYYDYDLEGLYSSYCGPLEYVLNPIGPAQTYLTYDGAFLLTLAPLAGVHADGINTHTLRAQLADWTSGWQDWPSCEGYPDCPVGWTAWNRPYHDTVFQVELVSCDITEHYADSVNSNAIIAGTDGYQEHSFVAGADPSITFDCTFTNFVSMQGGGCESVYTQIYSLHDNSGNDITTSLPNYIDASFNTAVPQVILYTTSVADEGTHTVILRSRIMLNPTDRPADSEIKFVFEILLDPCIVRNSLNAVTVDSMYYYINHDQVPTTQTFSIVTDAVGSCGEIKYTLVQPYATNFITLDEATRTITMQSFEGYDVGTHSFAIEAELLDYPFLTAEIGISMAFDVTIESICAETELLQTTIADMYYLEGDTASEQSILVTDDISGWQQRDGYTLCGPRAFSVSTDRPWLYSVDAEAHIAQFQVHDSRTVSENYFHTVTLTVSLPEYASIASIELEFKIFVLKKCSWQNISDLATYTYNQANGQPYIAPGQESYTYRVGADQKLLETEEFMTDAEFFIRSVGSTNLEGIKVCGEIALEFNRATMSFFGTLTANTSSGLPKFIKNVLIDDDDKVSIRVQTYDESFIGYHDFIAHLYLASHEVESSATIADQSLLTPDVLVQIQLTGDNFDNFLDIGDEATSTANSATADQSLGTIELEQFASTSEQLSQDLVSSFFSSEQATTLFAPAFEAAISLTDTYIDKLSDPEFGIPTEQLEAVQPYLTAALATLDIFNGLLNGEESAQVESFSEKLKVVEEVQKTIGQQIKDPVTQATMDQFIEILKQTIVDDLISRAFSPKFEEIEVDYFSTLKDMYLQDMNNGLDMSVQGKNLDKILQLLKGFPHPYPLLTESSQQGELTIIFSQEIFMPYSGEDLDIYVQWLIDQDFMSLEILEDEFVEQVTGTPKFDASYLSAKSTLPSEEMPENSRRQLQSDDLVAEEPQAEIENDIPFDKSFTWSVTKLTSAELRVKVNYAKSDDISSQTKDKMKVTFNLINFVMGQNQVVPDQEFMKSMFPITQAIKIPRQQSVALTEFGESISNSFTAAAGAAQIGTLIGFSIIKGSLNNLWGSINAISLIAHLPMFMIQYPEFLAGMFEQLINLVTFDVIESLAEVDVTIDYDASPTMAFNDGFETLGYDSSEPIGLLGTVNFVLAILILKTIWFGVRLLLPKNVQDRLGRATGTDYSAEWIRFFLQVSMELFITVGAVFYPRDEDLRLHDFEEKTNFDKFAITYTAILFVASAIFCVLIAVVTLCCTTKKVAAAINIRRFELRLVVEKVYRDKAVRELQKQIIKLESEQKPEDMDFAEVYIEQVGSVMQLKSSDQLQKKLEKQNKRLSYFSEFFEGLEPHLMIAQVYNLVYVVRRMILVLAAICLQDYPFFQIATMTVLCLLNQAYLRHAQLFSSRRFYKIEVINDLFVYLCSMLSMALLSTQSRDQENAVGYTLFACIVIDLLINLAILLKDGISSCTAKIKVKYANYSQKSNVWDRADHRICQCSCVTCGSLASKTTLMAAKVEGNLMKWNGKLNELKDFTIKVYKCVLEPIEQDEENPCSSIDLGLDMTSFDMLDQSVFQSHEKNGKTKQNKVMAIKETVEVELQSIHSMDIRHSRREKIQVQNPLQTMTQVQNRDNNMSQSSVSESSMPSEESQLSSEDCEQISAPDKSISSQQDHSYESSDVSSQSANSEDQEHQPDFTAKYEFFRPKTMKQKRYKRWLRKHCQDFDQDREKTSAKNKAKRLRETSQKESLEAVQSHLREFFSISERSNESGSDLYGGSKVKPDVSHRADEEQFKPLKLLGNDFDADVPKQAYQVRTINQHDAMKQFGSLQESLKNHYEDPTKEASQTVLDIDELLAASVFEDDQPPYDNTKDLSSFGDAKYDTSSSRVFNRISSSNHEYRNVQGDRIQNFVDHINGRQGQVNGILVSIPEEEKED